jgi:KUP system potassium uptake protein
MDLFIKEMSKRPPVRVPGVAVFMTSDLSGAPPVLLHHLKHNKVLHEKVILMSSSPGDPSGSTGQADRAQRAGCGHLHGDRILWLHGVAQRAEIVQGWRLSAFTPRSTRRPSIRPGDAAAHQGRSRQAGGLSARGLWMAMWRKRIFMVMSTNAGPQRPFRAAAQPGDRAGGQVQI